jgi:hypothetical protein
MALLRVDVREAPSATGGHQVIHAHPLDVLGHRELEDGFEVGHGVRSEREPDTALDARAAEGA